MSSRERTRSKGRGKNNKKKNSFHLLLFLVSHSILLFTTRIDIAFVAPNTTVVIIKKTKQKFKKTKKFHTNLHRIFLAFALSLFTTNCAQKEDDDDKPFFPVFGLWERRRRRHAQKKKKDGAVFVADALERKHNGIIIHIEDEEP